MGQRPTKAAENIFCKCRLAAGDYNDRLKSREGAAEALGVSPSTVADWELGNTRPPVEAVMRMADLYNAPELLNEYCAVLCPIGQQCVRRIEVKELDRSILELVGSLGHCGGIREGLLDITADGVIADDERPRLAEMIKSLELLSTRTDELKLCLKKRLGEVSEI